MTTLLIVYHTLTGGTLQMAQAAASGAAAAEAALDRLNGRPCACLICSGIDGQGAARQVERIAGGVGAVRQRARAAVYCRAR